MTDGKMKMIAKRTEEVLRFRQTLTDETDRGCALMAAAYLDSQLEELLQLCFVDSPDVRKEILGQSKPLGSFSSRIDMCFLLGVISTNVHRDLHLVRKIRNAFGHDPKPIDFNTQAIANRCRELYYAVVDENASARERFMNAVYGNLASIHAAGFERDHPKLAKDLDLNPKRRKEINDRKNAFVDFFLKNLNSNDPSDKK